MEKEQAEIPAGNDSPKSDGGQSVPEIVIPKRGRGRPPGSSSGVREKIGQGSPSPAPKNSAPRASGNKSSVGGEPSDAAKFIATGLMGLFEMGEGILHGALERKIRKRMPGKAAEFLEMCENASFKAKEKEMIISSAGQIIERYDLLTSHAPEVVLTVVMLQHSMRQISLVRFVNSVTARKMVEVEPDGATKTPAQEAAEANK